MTTPQPAASDRCDLCNWTYAEHTELNHLCPTTRPMLGVQPVFTPKPVEAEGYGYQPKDTVDTSNPPRQKAGAEATGKSPEDDFKKRLKENLSTEYFGMHEALFMPPSQFDKLLKLIDETKL